MIQATLSPAASYLVIDSSCSIVFIGLLRQSTWVSCSTIENEALQALFDGTRKCLQEGQIDLPDIDGFIYCCGPGSVLGIRLGVMAIRTWKALPALSEKPVWQYGSLAFAGYGSLHHGKDTCIHVVSPYRKGVWNHLKIEKGRMDGRPQLLDQNEISEMLEPVFLLRQRSGDAIRETGMLEVSCDFSLFPEFAYGTNLLRFVEEPDVFSVKTTAYRKWQAERHR